MCQEALPVKLGGQSSLWRLPNSSHSSSSSSSDSAAAYLEMTASSTLPRPSFLLKSTCITWAGNGLRQLDCLHCRQHLRPTTLLPAGRPGRCNCGRPCRRKMCRQLAHYQRAELPTFAWRCSAARRHSKWHTTLANPSKRTCGSACCRAICARGLPSSRRTIRTSRPSNRSSGCQRASAPSAAAKSRIVPMVFNRPEAPRLKPSNQSPKLKPPPPLPPPPPPPPAETKVKQDERKCSGLQRKTQQDGIPAWRCKLKQKQGWQRLTPLTAAAAAATTLPLTLLCDLERILLALKVGGSTGHACRLQQG